MPHCADCGSDLPAFQTLCSKCYDARYADLGRPKSILESVRQSGSNLRRKQVLEDRIRVQPWWLGWCFAVIGVGCDWYSAFEWLYGTYSLSSPPVLRGLVLIVGLCASISFLSVRRHSLASRKLPWAFFTLSYILFTFMIMPYVRLPIVELVNHSIRWVGGLW